MICTHELPIKITATDRAGMERDLDEAVNLAIGLAAKEGRQGVLVTRHDYVSFTVNLCDSVPFGLTRERQDW